MNNEYEVKFFLENIQDFRKLLGAVGATKVYDEFLQERSVFSLPKGYEKEGAWVRVRKESDKITMSYKYVHGDTIDDQKEVCLIVDNFDNAVNFLESVGCVNKAFQQNKREKWKLGSTEITIDTWPYLDTFVEIEGETIEKIKDVCITLGFDYNLGLFGAADLLINKKYGVPYSVINDQTPRITFDDPNPWLNWEYRSKK